MQVCPEQQEVSCCSLAVDFVAYQHGQQLELCGKWRLMEA